MKSSNQFLVKLSLLPVLSAVLVLCFAERVSATALSGNTTMYYRYSDREGTDLQTTDSYWRWSVSPTAVICGIPVSFNMLLSSVQSENRQDVNLFSAIASPGKSTDSGFFSFIRHIGIGTRNPCFSRFTLNGVRVDGLDMEFSPGAFSIALAAGRTSKAIEAAENRLPVYSQMMYAVRTGFGNTGESHVHLSFLHAWDDAESVPEDPAFQVTPEENFVVGIDTRFLLFDDMVRLDSDVAVSMFTRDTRSPEVELDELPGWINDIFNPNISTGVDYAYSVNTRMNFGVTSLSGTVSRVGPGYKTLGSPYLRSDDFMYEIRADRRFLDRQMTIGGYYRRNRDNLLPWKEYTTISHAYGVRTSLTFRNRPYLHLNFAPYYRKSEDNPAADVRTSLFSATAGYTLHSHGLSFTSNLMFYLQKNLFNEGSNDYRARSYSLREMVGFQFPLMLSAGASLLSTDYQGEQSDLYILDARSSYSPGGRWMVALGGSYSYQEEMDKSSGKITLGFPLFHFSTLNLSGRYTVFHDDEEENYNEFTFDTSLSASW